jgi:integrase/recombinase XerC
MNEIAEFVTFLAKERNDSPHTVKAYEHDLGAFAAFCENYYGGPWSWAGVDRLAVRGFLAAEQRRGLAKRSVARALSALRTFYRFLNATRGLEVNPARAARTPKLDRTLPAYLNRAEMELLFAEAEARAAAGGFREARDLAMLELFYSTGMRLSELAGLNDPDVDLVSDQIKLRGKGKKERIVPVGSHATGALRKYVQLRDRVLAGLRGGGGTRPVFVNMRGTRTTRCGTPLRRICSMRGPISDRCRNYSATLRWGPRRCILIRRSNVSKRSITRRIHGPKAIHVPGHAQHDDSLRPPGRQGRHWRRRPGHGR